MTTEQAIELALLAEADERLLETYGAHPATGIALLWIERAYALMAQIEMLEEGNDGDGVAQGG